MEPKFDNLDQLIYRSKEELKVSSNYNEVLLDKLNCGVNKDDKRKESVLNLFDKTAGLSFVMTGFLFTLINIFGLNNQIIEFMFKLKEIYLLINLR